MQLMAILPLSDVVVELITYYVDCHLGM